MIALDGGGLLAAPLLTREVALARRSPLPRAPGVYAWFFRRPPALVPTEGCLCRDGLILLYVGIAPKPAPSNGRPPSRATLRSRVQYHLRGNAEGSTLRLSLGCLLGNELGIELRRVGNGTRMTFSTGEERLSTWMAENALVSWVETAEPWLLEDRLIQTWPLPLNLQGNSHHPFRPKLSRIRAEARDRGRLLPVIQV